MFNPFSWISAIFTLPKLGETADPAAVALGQHKMTVQRPLYPVLDSTPITSDIHTLLDLIESVHSPDFDFLERLRQCDVTKVTHYRSKSGQAHELIVLGMTYRGNDDVTETRLFRLDRFRIDFVKGSERSAPRGWTKLSYEMLHAALQSPDRHDSVTVSDRLTGRTGGVITDDHRIVREFDIPQGKLSLLEALVIADTLNACTLDYSNLVHICQLWTVNLFIILKAVVDKRVQQGVSVRDGPAAAEAGTAHDLKLVDTTTGCASPELLQATDQRLQKLVHSLSSGKLLEAESTELVAAIRKDIQLLERVVANGSIESGLDRNSTTAPDNCMSTKRIISLAQDSLDTLHKRIQSTIESRVREHQERFRRAEQDLVQQDPLVDPGDENAHPVTSAATKSNEQPSATVYESELDRMKSESGRRGGQQRDPTC